MKNFKHVGTGNTGRFIKRYRATGDSYFTMQIQMLGRIFYAPECEFIEIYVEETELFKHTQKEIRNI